MFLTGGCNYKKDYHSFVFIVLFVFSSFRSISLFTRTTNPRIYSFTTKSRYCFGIKQNKRSTSRSKKGSTKLLNRKESSERNILFKFRKNQYSSNNCISIIYPLGSTGCRWSMEDSKQFS